MVSIAVLGSINLDIVARAERLPVAGETITGADLTRYPGGKGANQALAARRLGADVSLIGCVGRDAEADAARVLLREAGVDLTGVVIADDVATGVALISVATSGENQIVVAPGANRRLVPEDLALPAVDALICQLEIPADTVAFAAQHFEGFFCANLAPATRVDVTVLQRADLIVINETEAAWYGDTLAACRGLIATTFGAAGAVLSRDGKDLARVLPPRVTAIDTTAAGDAFTAALTLALIEGQGYEAALRFACAAGAAASLKPGAQPSLPTREEVEALL